MTITINGVVLDEREIDREAENHAGTPDPRAAAACALAIRELLLQRARYLGDAEPQADPDALIDRLLAREATMPEPTDDECRRIYDAHPERYTVGEIVEASHILFAVTPNAPVEAIRTQAEATLRQAQAEPESFAELAQRFSNCPSGAQGGSLGQLSRGDTVPEFESAVFADGEGVLPRLVNTRYGFHVVRVARRVTGRKIDFELARAGIARVLSARVHRKAAEQYVRILAARAKISGVDLGASASPLMQ